jgi:hypothetical protein
MSVDIDFQKARAPLRGFQRATVDHVVERLTAPHGSSRFLVADEVGLGKTLVARGVVASFVERRRDSTGRIDILYVCCNQALARENLTKIRLGAAGKEIPGTRLTLLARDAKALDPNLNFISLTPSTAMRTTGMGLVDERLILHQLLHERFGNAAWLSNFLRGQVRRDRWERQVVYNIPLEEEARKRFGARLEAQPTLLSELEEMKDPFRRVDSKAAAEPEIAGKAYRLVGELRNLLAQACIDLVQPDLIILDEFQRFKELLVTDDEPSSPEAELARQLFSYRTPEGHPVALLLLSATPYRMLTTRAEDPENHHEDFIQTLRFLYGSEERTARVKRDMDAYGEHLRLAAARKPHRLDEIRQGLETQLLEVMCRRERVGATEGRDGMVTEARPTARLSHTDVAQYLALEDVRQALGSHDLVELWKSAPYLLNFAKQYQFKSQLEADSRSSELRAAVQKHVHRHLSDEAIQAYSEVDPGNARLRLLLDETVSGERWKMLWIPPSMPYWPLGGPWAGHAHFTKKLLFSSWNVVPDAVSALVSYEVERRMVAGAAAGKGGYAPFYDKSAERLRFTVSKGRPSAMTALALQLPCLALADLHPLSLAKDGGEVRTAMRKQIGRLLERLVPLQTGAEVDPRWYWAALLLLEADKQGLARCLEAAQSEERSGEDVEPDEDLAEGDGKQRGRKGFKRHLAEALELLRSSDPELGAFPEDLVEVLTAFALGGPAVLWARTLAGFGVPDDVRRREAMRLGEATRSLFNHPPVVAMLGQSAGDESYWRTTLDYAIAGNLQALLDEQAHLLWEGEGWSTDEISTLARAVTDKLVEALTIRTSRVRPDYLNVRERSVAIEDKGTSIRTHFALRYGSVRGTGEASEVREDTVRNAFKSPFYPFVLASTSVGQEGLDFHPWCHSVWHWNLPGNPVDLEQREGRVHRYKGHAVRKNIAERHQGALREAWKPGEDPWAKLFALAEEAARREGESELVPCWLAPGEHKVERCVPVLPLSREVEQLERLKRSLAVYRVAFGQPRQEELLRLLEVGEQTTEEMDGWVLRLEVG